MDDAWALPESLHDGLFTSAEAREAGVGAERLRGHRTIRLARDVYADASAPIDLRRRATAALRSVDGSAWLGHATAASLYGLPLPPRLRELDRIDVTVPSPQHAPRGKGLRGRQRALDPAQIRLVDALRMSSPAQVFVDGADYLSFEDLVALGDAIVKERAPLATRDELRAAVAAHTGQRGHRRLLAAAHALHPRAWSRPETIVRLGLEILGAPEPWCNVPVVLEGVTLAPDVAFWRSGVLIEVEGDQHRTDRDLAPIVERIRARHRASVELPRIAGFFTGIPAFGEVRWWEC
ncbi:MAG: hypothetical protein WC580_10505 [Agrococcus sp.]